MTQYSSEFASRRAGVCAHLTALPGPHGIGELGTPALRFMDWMAAHRLSVWQFLPLGPTGYGDSPYLPLSAFAGNPLLINIDMLAEWNLLDRSEVPAPDPEPTDCVDYARVTAIKSPPLALAAARFGQSPDRTLRDEYETFCAHNDAAWLDAFAAYSVLKAHHGGRAWPEWQPSGTPAQSLIGQVAHAHPAEWHQIKCIQFFFARQFRALRDAAHERGIRLFGDVPIYLPLDCAESWSRPELLQLNGDFTPVEVSGVPPDYFSDDGQLWGTPVYCWEAHAADGFAWWIARLRQALAAADFVRLDHFRGFDEYWSVPFGAETARDGRWRAGPGGALFDALAAAFGDAPFVAEDLGLITESVTELRKAYALPGMQVLQFLVNTPDFDRDAIGEDSVCYTGTHDNDTCEGWFGGSRGRVTGASLAALQQTVRHNTGEFSDSIHKAMISLCFSTQARLAIAPLQDYLGLGSESRFNIPGQTTGNWCWRVSRAALDRGDLGYIGDAAARYGRA